MFSKAIKQGPPQKPFIAKKSNLAKWLEVNE
jgi:hypothetical protein